MRVLNAYCELSNQPPRSQLLFKKGEKTTIFLILKILPITTRLSLTGLESSLNLKNTADRPPSHIDTSSTLGKVADTAINLAGHLIAFSRLTIASNT